MSWVTAIALRFTQIITAPALVIMQITTVPALMIHLTVIIIALLSRIITIYCFSEEPASEVTSLTSGISLSRRSAVAWSLATRAWVSRNGSMT